MSEISITRGLVQLKTLGERIAKAQRESVFVGFKYQGEEKLKITPNHYQKIMDLIAYRKSLKGAIVQSNAVTRVSINGNDYTVAEAIERKNSIQFEKDLLNEMKRQYAQVTQKVEISNQQVQKKLDRLIEASFGSNQKRSEEEIKTFSENYLKFNKAELVDTLKLSEKIDGLEDSIMKFEAEVDITLSESNSRTHIKV